MSTISTPPVTIPVDLLFQRPPCVGTDGCEKFCRQFLTRMVGRYVGEHAPFPGQTEAAVLDVRDFDHDAYMEAVRGVHKGAALRQAKKSDREGLVVDRFAWRNHIPDAVEINQSMDVRSGGVMRGSYRRTVEEMGGAPTRLHPTVEPECPVHGVWDWGMFEPRPGHRQGDVTVDRRLVAYVRFKRQGSLGIYTTLLGHGDYLHLGVMYRLHYAIMEWIGRDRPAGLEHLLYGGFGDGNEGLRMWKKRCLFQSARLVLSNRPECGET